MKKMCDVCFSYVEKLHIVKTNDHHTFMCDECYEDYKNNLGAVLVG